MKKTSKILICLACLLCFAVFGCTPGPSICDITEPGTSILCNTAEKYDVKLEDIGNTFLIANAIAIGEGLYSRGQALKVLRDLRYLIDEDTTYLFFRKVLMKWTSNYPGLFEISMIYLGDFALDLGLYDTDRAILISWLDARILELGG